MHSKQWLAAATQEVDSSREMSNPGIKKWNSACVEALQTSAETLIKIYCLLQKLSIFLWGKSWGSKSENCKHKEKLFFIPRHIIDNSTFYMKLKYYQYD